MQKVKAEVLCAFLRELREEHEKSLYDTVEYTEMKRASNRELFTVLHRLVLYSHAQTELLTELKHRFLTSKDGSDIMMLSKIEHQLERLGEILDEIS